MDLSYVSVADQRYFGMDLTVGQVVDVSAWPARAVRRAVWSGVLAAVAGGGGLGGANQILGSAQLSVAIGPSSGVGVPVYAPDGVPGIGVCTPFFTSVADAPVHVMTRMIEPVDISYLDLTVVSADGASFADLSNASPVPVLAGTNQVDFGSDFATYGAGAGLVGHQSYISVADPGLYYANLFVET